MADLSDVSAALRDIAAAALYPTPPSGTDPSPVAGLPVWIAAGWPNPESLATRMKAGHGMVSIYPRPTDRNTTRFPNDWQVFSEAAATYVLTAVGQVITVAGSAPNPQRPQNIAVFLNGRAYTVQTSAGQTAVQVATALQAAFLPDHTASRTGAVLTIPNGVRIGALRIAATGVVTRELRRQERDFQIIVWAPSPTARDAIAQPVDIALASLERFTLPDGYSARLTYKSAMLNDFDQKAGIFRRDLFYSVDYPTTQTDTATGVVVVPVNVADEFGNPLCSIEA